MMSLFGFENLFAIEGELGRIVDDTFVFGNRVVPIVNGIPRFTPDISYSSGNFSLLRERHACLQLDSHNGTTDRMDTILLRTQWPKEFFANKLILECGCGAGPDTEILRQFGATVVSVDLAGVDVCKRNVDHLAAGCIVQADIANLPLRKGTFDIVFCHRVLQHTPNPEFTLNHILQFVKPSGYAFVHSYARTWRQMIRWKYALRPITKRLPPSVLYSLINAAAPFLFRLTEFLYRLPKGRQIAYHLVPFLNYSGLPKLRGMSDQAVLEYAIHDTFDALSPTFDRPVSATKMKHIATKWLGNDFEVVEQATITLLRSKL